MDNLNNEHKAKVKVARTLKELLQMEYQSKGLDLLVSDKLYVSAPRRTGKSLSAHIHNLKSMKISQLNALLEVQLNRAGHEPTDTKCKICTRHTYHESNYCAKCIATIMWNDHNTAAYRELSLATQTAIYCIVQGMVE